MIILNSMKSNMRKTLNLLMTISFACIVLLLSLKSVSGQSPNTLLNQKIDLDLSNTTVFYVLNKLAIDKRIPIGLERASDYRQKLYEKMYVENGEIKWQPDTIKIKSGTLKEILDSLFSQDLQYNWELRDGVINIFPVESRDEFLKKLLDTKIGKFSHEKGINKFQVRDAILKLPEAKQLLKEEKVELLRRDYPNSHYLYPDNEIDANISDTDVRSVLNKIVRDSPHKIWVIERIGDNKRYLLLSF